MNKFNIIKKSRKNSEDLDEKIEYLNKECQKTGLNEITMSTSGIYQGSTQIPNQDYSDFESQSQGGYGLGFSGADGNSAGNANLINGVAYSPPHPVTGVRRAASHVRDGLGGTEPLRPGEITFRGFSNNPPPYTMGSALWFFDADYDNGAGQPAGRWCNLEWSNFPGSIGWGFWDTIKTGQFAGLYKFETNLSLHPCGDISGKIAGINFGTNGALGAPQTTVLTQNRMDDPTHLPINIDGISPQALEYLRGRVNGNNIASGANYDLYMWLLKTYPNRPEAAEWYLNTGKTQNNPFLPMGSYVPRASNPSNNDPLIAGSLSGPRNSVNYPPTPGRPHPGAGWKWYPDAKGGKGDYLPVPIRLSSYKPKGKTLSESVKSKNFNIIKKSRKKSKGIDEKIEYLDKECQKTGLNEIMGTADMYSVQGSEPNPSHNAFKSLSHDGQPLGFSGADFNIFTEPIGGLKYSPPHPVTGERQRASSWFGIASGFGPVAAGSDRQIMWIFDQSLAGGFGRYFSLELTKGDNPFWGTWISTAFGTEMLVPYNGSNSPLSDNIKNDLNNLNINNFRNPDDFGPPTNPVLFKNDLGDPTFLPINIPDLSGEAFDYLKNKAYADKIARTGKYPNASDQKFLQDYLNNISDPVRQQSERMRIFKLNGVWFPLASAGEPVSDTNIPSPFAGAQDGDEFAFLPFGGGNNKTPEKPTKRTNKGTFDAQRASSGMYPNMTPEKFFQKYGMSYNEYLNLP